MSEIVSPATEKAAAQRVNHVNELSRFWLISVETVDAAGNPTSFRITRNNFEHALVDGPGVPMALANLDKMVDEARV